MKTRVIASTKVGYEMPIEEAILFSGKEAGICYMPQTVDELLAEPEEKTKKRADGNMKSGHHSVFDHPRYNFVFEEMPKIMAMVLNNEKVYSTSEKSARYTKMKPSKEEQLLYEKWIGIFECRIREKYPCLTEVQTNKLARENARYMISVFTPATTMGYSVTLEQMSYVLHMMEDFANEESTANTPEIARFIKRLKPCFTEFVKLNEKYKVEGISPDAKSRKLSLFSNVARPDEWGENYCTTYWASFAQLAQAQRHRTLNYEISVSSLEAQKYFVPPIIRNTLLEEDWLVDISSLAEYFPQGKMVLVNERGTAENFILKCKERLCGCAQLEIALQTEETLYKYIEATKVSNPRVCEYLKQYAVGPRCKFPDYVCPKPNCVLGPADALNRLI